MSLVYAKKKLSYFSTALASCPQGKAHSVTPTRRKGKKIQPDPRTFRTFARKLRG